MKQLSKIRLDPSGSDFIGGITGKHIGCRVLGSVPEALGGDPTFPVPHCLVEDMAEQSDFLESSLFIHQVLFLYIAFQRRVCTYCITPLNTELFFVNRERDFKKCVL